MQAPCPTGHTLPPGRHALHAAGGAGRIRRRELVPVLRLRVAAPRRRRPRQAGRRLRAQGTRPDDGGAFFRSMPIWGHFCWGPEPISKLLSPSTTHRTHSGDYGWRHSSASTDLMPQPHWILQLAALQVIHTSDSAAAGNDFNKVNSTAHNQYLATATAPGGKNLYAITQVSAVTVRVATIRYAVFTCDKVPCSAC